eukprot:m51a1_g13857 putative nuclear pore complex protein (605) ;mRNA; f:585477-587640
MAAIDALFAGEPEIVARDAPVDTAIPEAGASSLRKSASDASWKFMVATHYMFARIQRLRQDLSPAELAYEASRASMIMTLVDNLNAEATATGSSEIASLASSWARTAQVWECFNIGFLTPRAAPVAPQLLSWLVTYTDALANVEQSIREAASGSTRTCLLQSLAYGVPEAAVDILEMNGSSAATALLAVVRAMPSWDVEALGETLDERWQRWQRAVGDTRLAERLRGNEELSDALRLLRGEESALRNVCTTWQSLLVAKVLYQYPTATLDSLSIIIQEAREAMPGDSEIEEAMDEAMCGDADALVAARRSLGAWLPAHMSDILLCLGSQTGVTDAVRDEYVFEYARTEPVLLAPTAWRAAADYWDSACSAASEESRISGITDCLVRAPLRTDRDACQVVCECTRLAAPVEVSAQIHRRVAREKLRRGLWGDAVRWAAGAGPRVAARVAAFVVDRCVEAGTPDDLDGVTRAIDAMPSIADQQQPGGAVNAVSTRASFVTAYRRLHVLRERGAGLEYAQTLMGLLHADGAPRRYWARLIVDAVPVLEARPPVFGREDTCELMAQLEGLVMSHRQHVYLAGVAPDNLERARLALAQNLARVSLGPAH